MCLGHLSLHISIGTGIILIIFVQTYFPDEVHRLIYINTIGGWRVGGHGNNLLVVSFVSIDSFVRKLMLSRLGGSMGCVWVGRVGRCVVSGEVRWVDGLYPGGSMCCVMLGRVCRWIVSG